MVEIIAAFMTTIDIIVIFSVLQVRKRKLVLALWTGFLNTLVPLIGFMLGEMTVSMFSVWSSMLSSFLLILIGIHMMIQDHHPQVSSIKLSPFFLAFIVSLDTLSVSVSFGMLQMNKLLFSAASGIFALVLSYCSLYIAIQLRVKNGKRLSQLGGIVFIVIGIMYWF